MVGSRVAHYVLLRQVGAGGMGAVYEAKDEQTGMRVALKVLRSEFAQNREALTRFVNEARATNLIDHPGIVKIFESGQLENGIAYLVMEFLEGETLSARMRRYQGPMPEIEVRRMGWQLASVLAAAHKKTIIHRDLKPGNIMVVPDPLLPGVDRIKLLDFGIAKLDTRSLNLEDPQTRTGIVMGTPHYMSPEQCRGAGQVDGAADVYSLGVILFQMLTGRLPFVPTDDGEGMIMAMHIYEAPPRPRSLVSNISPAMEQLVLDMLKKDRTERPSMGAVSGRLEEIGGSMGLAMDVSVTFEDDLGPTTKRAAVPLTGPIGGAASPAGLGQSAPNARSLAAAGAPTLVGKSSPLAGMGSPLAGREMATLVSAAATSQPSTLGTGTGQVSSVAGPAARRRRLFYVAGALAALAGLFAIALLLQRGGKPPADDKGPVAAITAPKEKEPPPPAKHCELVSEPTGSEVLRESDHKVLGTTPFKLEQAAGAPPLVLLLRHAGYSDRALSLDCGSGPTHSEKLESLPKPEGSAGASKTKPVRGKAKAKRVVKKKAAKKKKGKRSPGGVSLME